MKKSVWVEGSSEPMVGYFRIVGVRCLAPDVRDTLEALVPDGTVLWNATTIDEVDINQLSRSVRRSIGTDVNTPVWHLSGKVWYPADS